MSTYPKAYETLEDARQWMGEFVIWYNTEHMHFSIGYVTPHQMRYGHASAIFEQRNATLQRARELTIRSAGDQARKCMEH